MNNLYEVLEICLQDIEQGADIDTVLFHYPELADELRPILEASANARSMAIVAPSAEMVQRNRTKVLQLAAQMRESKVRSSSRRIWFVSLRRVAVTLAVVITLFVSGTGLVRAASTTLPGDNLYPVKRTWEDVLLLFTFNLQQREALEVEHENKRLHELREVFAEGRSVEVEFAGLVTSQNGTEWVVAGIPVVISAQTEVRDGSIAVGIAVRVKGHTQGTNTVLAERIKVLPPDAKLPDEVEVEEEDHEGPNQQNEDNSGKGSEDEAPKIEGTKTPESESESKDESSNSGSGSDNSGPGLNDNGNDSGSSNEDNSGSSKNDNGGSDDNGGDDNSGSNSNDGGGGHDSGDDSGGDNSSSSGDDGGGGDD